jgi:acylphosphatase
MAFLLPMTNHPEQLHAIVQGGVQGVNFRSTTQSRARRLGLAGWVRNRSDGTVEVLAQGPKPALEQLLQFLHQGPPAASVSAVQAEWGAAEPALKRFDIEW